MPKINVSPKENFPSHHIALVDNNGTAVGLVLTDNQGNPDGTGLSSQPYPRSAIKTFSGQSDYSSEEPPFNPIQQADFSGGMGKEVFDDDSTRYLWSEGINTSQPGKVMLGPAFLQEVMEQAGLYQTNIDDASVKFQFLSGLRYYCASFVAPWSSDFLYPTISVRRVGSPDETKSDWYVHLYSDSAGAPGTLLRSSTAFTVAKMNDYADSWSETGQIRANFAMTSAYTLAAGTTYWVVVDTGNNTDPNNCFEIAVSGTDKTSGKYAITLGTYFPFNPVHVTFTKGVNAVRFKYLTYKGARYAAAMYTNMSTNSFLLQNGDRGNCDDNSADKTKIIDATKNWPTDIWKGATVWVRRGTYPTQSGFFEYREIVSNTATVLTLKKSFWDTTATTDEYIITDTPVWTTRISDIGFPATDAVVFNDQIVFSQEGAVSADGFVGYSAYGSGVWTEAMKGVNCTYVAKYSDFMEVIDADERLQDNRNKQMLIGGSIYGRSGLDRHIAIADPLEGFHGNFVYNGASTATGSAHVIETLLGTQWNVRAPTEISVANVTPAGNHGQWKAVIAAGFTTGNVMADKITSVDITKATNLIGMMYSTVALNANDFKIKWSDTAALGGTPVAHNLPAAAANTWNQFNLTIAPTQAPAPNESAVISLGIERAVNKGAQNFYTYGLHFVDANPNYVGNGTWTDAVGRITGHTTYTGSQTGSQKLSLWIFTDEGRIMEYQQASRQFVELMTPAKYSFYGPDFGRASIQHGLYLYFSNNRDLLRYYNNQIDDVGANRDDGFPGKLTRSRVHNLLSVPGNLFALYQYERYSNIWDYAGDYSLTETPFIMAKGDSTGWWNFGKSDFVPDANPLRDLGYRNGTLKPGKIVGHIGAQTLWGWDYSLRPDQEPAGSYRFAPIGAITTGRYYAGRRDVEKFWKSLKITADNLNDGRGLTPRVIIRAQYKTDNTNDEWVDLPEIFDTSPFKQVDLATDNRITGKWIQFKLYFETENDEVTPIMYSIVIDAMIRVPSKDAYQLTFRLANDETNLRGEPEDLSAKQKYDILRNWLAEAAPLKLLSLDELTHGISVFPEPIPIRRVFREVAEGDQAKTTWICNMTLLEI